MSERMIFNVFRRRKGIFRRQWCAQVLNHPEISGWGRTHEEAILSAEAEYNKVKEKERKTKEVKE